jgi:tetratricopeptide (TPR) repeat protein
VLVAAFFGTFLLFLALGLLALLVTAALDRAIGKERALLLWAVAIVGIAWLLRPVAPPRENPRPQVLDLAKLTKVDPSSPVDFAGDPFARTPIAPFERNPFREHSDTSSLPPIDVAPPPEVPLAFPLPPTVPSVGPAARRLYRGTLPAVAAGDGSKLPPIPVDGFSSYAPKPEDVFDWVVEAERRYYIYISQIDGVAEGAPGFERLKWNLALQEGPPVFDKDWRELQVQWASIGPEEAAAKALGDVAKAKRKNVVTTRAGEKDRRWFLRRSVENLYVEALRRQGNPNPETLSAEQLKAAAAEMAQLGATGKEDGAGWDRAVRLLDLALAKARERAGSEGLQSEILVALVEAHRALHDERALLATLAAYASRNPREGEGAAWIGEVFVRGLHLPAGGLSFLDRAVALEPTLREAHLGRGDALTLLDDHAAALKAYGEATKLRAGPDAAVREAEAHLRLGRLADARRAADQALAAAPFDPRALLAKGAAQYAAGEVGAARDTFAQAATLPGEGAAGIAARRHRAEALYDLGVAEWRLGHGDAAREAFEALERALQSGAQRGRSADESVSVDLGLALLALGAGDDGAAREALERARAEAPGIAYVEMLAGVMALGRAVPTAAAAPAGAAPAPAAPGAAPAPAAPAPVASDARSARLAFEKALALEPALAELDGWLAEARMQVAETSSAAGVPPMESAPDFDAAIRFAERAARREAEADPKNPDFRVREAALRLRAAHLPERRRFDEARRTAEAVVKSIAREDRRALAIQGYANYRLGPYGSYPDGGREVDPYSEAIRNFQQVLDVPASPDDPLRRYVATTLDRVKRWQALELKSIGFGETRMSAEWELDESKGVRASPDAGRLRFWDSDRAKGAFQDGTIDEPTVRARSEKQFDKLAFERLRVKVWIPKTDRTGQTINNVTFGVQVQAPSRPTGLSKVQGVGVFYDKGKVAVRVGGSADAARRDGLVHRVLKDGKEVDWPQDDPAKYVMVEIERVDAKDGWLVVRLYPQGSEDVPPGEKEEDHAARHEVFREKLGTFRATRGTAEVWFGGYSTKSQNWDVSVDDLHVVRQRGQ